MFQPWAELLAFLVKRNAKMDEKEFTMDEIARRRDEVVRKMANTPPQPSAKARARSPHRTRKKAGADPATRNGRATHEG